MEPLGRFELPTFPLPMGCYTPKPQWRHILEKQFRFNDCGRRFKTHISKTTNSKCGERSEIRKPRSHSLVLRMTGNHVGFSLGSSNLPLGAITTYFLGDLMRHFKYTITKNNMNFENN
jgi:hypothetical protein